MTISEKSRFLGALYGHVVGDALGVPVEFSPRSLLEQNPVETMRGFGTHNQPTGTWSDDSSMMLCLLEGLLTDTDLSGIAWLFYSWLMKAHWTPHGKVFDVGTTTCEALYRVGTVKDPREGGYGGEYNQGNGSLMRTLPVALMHPGLSNEELAREAFDVSMLTHSHLTCQISCGVYTLFTQHLYNGVPLQEAWDIVRHWFLTHHAEGLKKSVKLHALLEKEWDNLTETPRSKISGSGFVLDTLQASLWCLGNSRSYEEAVLKAVNLGEDTDTTGAVTGGLAGCFYGLESIPPSWIQILARLDDLEEIFSRSWEKVGATP